jgi:hypothetical protein
MEYGYVRRSIKFKTSRTYLQTIFPSLAFSFATPGTVVEATYTVETVDKLNRLSGGYHSFGLPIHGVQYAKQDGSKIYGTYLPVLFQSSPESIAASREELGMPTLFCNIEICNKNGSTQVQCRWDSAVFASMEWDSLNGAPESTAQVGDKSQGHGNPPAPPDNGLFIYRYIPTVGKGPADAEYPVFVPNGGSERKVIRTFNAGSAIVNFTAGSWETLPTLHHIAHALSEVPIYKIVEAKIEHGLGLDDFSEAEKIEEGTRSIGPHL